MRRSYIIYPAISCDELFIHIEGLEGFSFFFQVSFFSGREISNSNIQQGHKVRRTDKIFAFVLKEQSEAVDF